MNDIITSRKLTRTFVLIDVILVFVMSAIAIIDVVSKEKPGPGELVTNIIFQVLALLLLSQIWKLKNWARRIYIGLFVFGFFFLPFHFSSLIREFGSSPAISFSSFKRALDLVNLVFTFLFVALLFRGDVRSLFCSVPGKTSQRVVLLFAACALFLLGLFELKLKEKRLERMTDVSSLSEQRLEAVAFRDNSIEGNERLKLLVSEKEVNCDGGESPLWSILLNVRAENVRAGGKFNIDYGTEGNRAYKIMVEREDHDVAESGTVSFTRRSENGDLTGVFSLTTKRGKTIESGSFSAHWCGDLPKASGDIGGGT